MTPILFCKQVICYLKTHMKEMSVFVWQAWLKGIFMVHTSVICFHVRGWMRAATRHSAE